MGRWVRITTFACLVACASSSPAFAQTEAIVVDRVGSIVVDGARTPVATLSRWSVGARLRLGDGATLRLLFIETGAEFNASGPGVVRIGANSAVADAGAVIDQRAAPIGTRLRARPDSLAMGGVVMRGASLRARSPRGVLTRMPTQLSWDDLAADASYIVRIGTEDGQTLFEQRVRGQSLSFPDVELVAEGRYVWSVTLEQAPDRIPVTSTSPFEFAASSLRAEASRLEAGESASIADRIEFALWLESVGVSSEATQVWQRLALARPDDEVIVARARR